MGKERIKVNTDPQRQRFYENSSSGRRCNLSMHGGWPVLAGSSRLPVGSTFPASRHCLSDKLQLIQVVRGQACRQSSGQVNASA